VRLSRGSDSSQLPASDEAASCCSTDQGRRDDPTAFRHSESPSGGRNCPSGGCQGPSGTRQWSSGAV